MSYVDIKKLMARATESSSIYREYGLIIYMLGVPIFMGSPKFYDTGDVIPGIWGVPNPRDTGYHRAVWRIRGPGLSDR